MKTAAIIATVIATLLFLYSSYQLTYDPISRSTKDGILFYNFLIWFAVPGILWVIYLASSKK
jgi:hypothetical protein